MNHVLNLHRKDRVFLADVVDAWEHAAKSATSMPYRFVCMRLGLVLSPKGTLARLGPLYKMGLGAPLATGQQAMSWVHLDDVISFVVWASQFEQARGIYNVVAPQHVSNRDFSKLWPLFSIAHTCFRMFLHGYCGRFSVKWQHSSLKDNPSLLKDCLRPSLNGSSLN